MRPTSVARSDHTGLSVRSADGATGCVLELVTSTGNPVRWSGTILDERIGAQTARKGGTKRMSQSQRRHNDDRMRRAQSWYEHSLHAQCDDDKFVFLWIAFNAAYGLALLDPNVHPRAARKKEWEKLKGFLGKLIHKDTEQAIRDVLWGAKLSDRHGDGSLRGAVPRLLANQYVYCLFWHCVHNRVDNRWRAEFRRANDRCTRHLAVSKALVKPARVGYVLKEVFSRLYTLRNQMFHGGTTCGTGKGRGQLEDATRVMENLMPAVLSILQVHIGLHRSTDYWGVVAYPHVDDEGRLIDEDRITAR